LIEYYLNHIWSLHILSFSGPKRFTTQLKKAKVRIVAGEKRPPLSVKCEDLSFVSPLFPFYKAHTYKKLIKVS